MQLKLSEVDIGDGFSIDALVVDANDAPVGMLRIPQGDMAGESDFGEDGIEIFRLKNGESFDLYLRAARGELTEDEEEDFEEIESILDEVTTIPIGDDAMECSFESPALTPYTNRALEILAAALEGTTPPSGHIEGKSYDGEGDDDYDD